MNKLIVVTGGTKGIGRAIVERFSREGFDVAACSRKLADLELLRKEVENENGTKVFIYPADMSDRTQVKAFSEFVISLKRTIDILVNNAGFFTPGKISEEPDGTLERTINGNLYSAYYMTRGLIEGMKSSRKGHVFNMCSIASTMAYPNGGSYSISKFALLGFSKVLREEMKEYGIRVTAILPGATLTSSWEGSALPDDRFVSAEDVADAVFAAYALSGRSVVEEMIIRPQMGDI